MFAACGESKAETKTETKSEAAAPAATEQKSEAAAPAASEKSEAAAPAAPSGETYNLVVVNHDASTSMCEKYVETLCNMMSEDSGGRLQFQFNPGGSLLGATETIDGVKDGTADICWSCTSFFGSRFPISEFINLCANGITSGRMGTDVFQEMYEEIPEVQAEFKDWKVLALHACTFAPVSTVGKKIETKDDFKGLQLRAAGTVASQYLTALGATPISMPTSDVYESVEKKVIDGFANDWHNIDCFKLYEPIDYCLNLPINFTSCFVLMNKDTYEGLPEDLQAIIDKYANGYAGDMAGYWWDSCRYWVADKMKANNVEVYEPSEELLSWAQSEEVVGPIHEWYVGYLNDAGLDGQAIFDKCMEIVEKNKAAHADDWAAPYSYEDWNETP
jgi:TRAP-type C4-dicarboxylate transport system substrate-binding protein